MKTRTVNNLKNTNKMKNKKQEKFTPKVVNNLEKWCDQQKIDYQKGLLTDVQIKKMESIDGWTWEIETSARKNERIEEALLRGEASIWDKVSGTSLEDFIDYAKNGLAEFYDFNFLVFGFESESDDFPSAVGACRGDVELTRLFAKFSYVGLLCVLQRIKPEHIDLTQNINEN